jgi:gamma-glutamyltranspeptidase/glutathione hydrolase
MVAARDAFYRGDIARAIVACHKANGGLMTAHDLDEFHVQCLCGNASRDD